MIRSLPTPAFPRAGPASARAWARLVRLGPSLAAALLGLVLLAGVGLSQPLLVHNATHDTRHALGFPCH
jgi:cobalt transporter subunit CbtB